MIVDEIIKLAIIDAGIKIDAIYGKRWLNEGKDELAIDYDSACVKKTTTITCTDTNNYYDLPAGCLRIKEITDSQKIKYNDYIADETQIKFQNQDTYNMTYYEATSDVTTTTEEPSCHPLYHKILAFFIVYKALEDKKPEKSNLYYQKFLKNAKDTNNRLDRMKRNKVIPARRYR